MLSKLTALFRKQVKPVPYEFRPTPAHIEVLNFWAGEATEDLWLYRFAARQGKGLLAPDNTLSLSSVFGNREIIMKSPANAKVFFTGENVSKYAAYEDHCLDIVNLSLGFDYLDHPRYMRFPLWIQNVFQPGYDLTSIRETLEQITTDTRNGYRWNKNFCSLICRFDEGGQRTLMMNAMRRIEPVDSAGAYLNNTTALKDQYNDDKLAFLKDYQFNICPENSDRNGYVTEKIFHAIIAGCIPIYWGSNNHPEPEVLNQDAILFYENEAQLPALVKQVSDLRTNEKRYREFVMQDRFKPHAAEYIADMVNEAGQRIRKCLER
ncbi:glycosyltransferase family 10 domain-containing protein [Chitinophaga sp. 22321]|uniref:Glycosyltransferase family 10 (Fucosyltransferase) C-term n=1 Tax=Chitinophaga hostae TaxID=2831022 RepID=A0ABS5IU55_9BACT|nr:glycosyltransferase family 10 [Chitinophaga hostae]MBS0025782.1 hypothetical protein [Chitinophaga hostae]